VHRRGPAVVYRDDPRRYGQIEEEWTARLQPESPGGMIREPPAAEAGEAQVIYSVCNNPGGA
jgi:hypothetical protein